MSLEIPLLPFRLKNDVPHILLFLTENLKEIAFSAHKLKAGFAMLKAQGMRELIVDLEANCKADRPLAVKELYHLFLEDYPLLEQNLDRQFELLNKK